MFWINRICAVLSVMYIRNNWAFIAKQRMLKVFTRPRIIQDLEFVAQHYLTLRVINQWKGRRVLARMWILETGVWCSWPFDRVDNALLFDFSLVVSDEPVIRDQFYNGNVKTERGIVIHA